MDEQSFSSGLESFFVFYSVPNCTENYHAQFKIDRAILSNMLKLPMSSIHYWRMDGQRNELARNVEIILLKITFYHSYSIASNYKEQILGGLQLTFITISYINGKFCFLRLFYFIKTKNAFLYLRLLNLLVLLDRLDTVIN